MLLKIFLICLGAGVGALACYKLGECIKNKNKKKWKTKFSLSLWQREWSIYCLACLGAI